MKQKTITVKVLATMEKGNEFLEYEFPKLNEYLNDGWIIKDVFQTATNTNVAFLFLTFVIYKN